MNNHNIFLDKNNRWRDKTTGKLTNNPFSKRCEYEDCDNLVRSKKQTMCSNHVDWTKVAHGASLLMDTDIIFIASSVGSGLSDKEIVSKLKDRSHHIHHTEKSIMFAVRHHRRKYLLHRYDKKFYYKTIKKNYKEEYPVCEICGWDKTNVDVHHILQVKDFVDEIDYHKVENLISLCPNDHRLVEDIRKEDMIKYLEYIKPIKIGGINVQQ